MQEFWPQVVVGFQGISKVEWVAVAASFVCVYLTVRNNVWSWFFGFIGVVLYGYLFWQWRNYANCGLQLLYFAPIQFVGWYVWTRGGTSKTEDVPITHLTMKGRALAVLAVAGLTALLWATFRFWLPAAFPTLPKDPVPFADGFTTGISIVAQFLQVRKKVETWVLWIIADVVYAGYVFPKQGLYASMLLYIAFTVLAAMGAKEWRDKMREQESGREPGVLAGLPVEEWPKPSA